MRTPLRFIITGGATSLALAGALVLSSGTYRAQTRPAASPSKLRFDVSFIPQVHDAPITGRAFVMVTRSIDKQCRSRGCRSAGPACRSSAATWSSSQPEKIVSIDGSDLGTPLDSINDIPAGDYYVQAVVVVYSEFHRADGHVLWMHDDQWEGQRWNRAPGTLYSAVEKVHIDPNAGGVDQAGRRPRACRRSRCRPTRSTSSGSSSRARC